MSGVTNSHRRVLSRPNGSLILECVNCAILLRIASNTTTVNTEGPIAAINPIL